MPFSTDFIRLVSLLLRLVLVKTHHLWLLAHSHLTEMDGEDGVRSGALSIHLGAGCGPGQSTELQALQQLRNTRNVESIWIYFVMLDHHKPLSA